MRGTNFFATIFEWSREVIEAAETPFAKFAVFVLPILAPLVPAFMTGLNLFKLFTNLFDFDHADTISAAMSVIIAVVLELLGYVGAITFIRSLFRLVRNSKENSLWLPVILNGGAYLFYVVVMWLINYRLGEYFQTARIINSIFGALSLITIPTGLLAANHLSQKEVDEGDEKRRREDREDRLKRYAIKHGINPAEMISQERERRAKRKGAKPASHYKERMEAFISDTYRRTGIVPPVIDIVNKFNLNYDSAKGFVSGLRTKWMRDNNVK